MEENSTRKEYRKRLAELDVDLDNKLTKNEKIVFSKPMIKGGKPNWLGKY